MASQLRLALLYLAVGLAAGSWAPGPALRAAGRRVGIIYEVWHAPIAKALSGLPKPLTVEQLLRSGGGQNMTLAEIAAQNVGPQNPAIGFDNFYYHYTPSTTGTACIYKKRPNETAGYIPDCDHVEATLAAHANQLTQAGVDFVIVDLTNPTDPGPQAPPSCAGHTCEGDLLQLRPVEVLFEVWAALRASGVATPDIAVWQHLDDSGREIDFIFERILSNHSLQHMLLVDSATSKPVLFTPHSSDAPKQVAALEAEGFAVIEMWVLGSQAEFRKGKWVFMSYCTDGGDVGSGTTALDTTNTSSCRQGMTTNSPIGARGTALTVSPSYQMGYSSLPFQASGKLGGAMLRSQFVRAFEEVPDYLVISSYNEAIAQPQPNRNFNGAHSMGVYDGGDKEGGDKLWVDMLGTDVSRDLQPSVEGGTFYWDLLSSCLRVFALAANGSAPGGCADSSNSPSLMAEACCRKNSSADYATVYSLVYVSKSGSGGVGDALLTADLGEKKALIAAGGWKESCNHFGCNHLFCSGEGPACHCPALNASGSQGLGRGPFLLLASPEVSARRRPVWRCYDAKARSGGGSHSVASSPADCPAGSSEGLLGYAERSRSSAFPRSLRSCQSASDSPRYYSSVDVPCSDGDSQLELLGFVH